MGFFSSITDAVGDAVDSVKDGFESVGDGIAGVVGDVTGSDFLENLIDDAWSLENGIALASGVGIGAIGAKFLVNELGEQILPDNLQGLLDVGMMATGDLYGGIGGLGDLGGLGDIGKYTDIIDKVGDIDDFGDVLGMANDYFNPLGELPGIGGILGDTGLPLGELGNLAGIGGLANLNGISDFFNPSKGLFEGAQPFYSAFESLNSAFGGQLGGLPGIESILGGAGGAQNMGGLFQMVTRMIADYQRQMSGGNSPYRYIFNGIRA
jgi:hypothetical protein